MKRSLVLVFVSVLFVAGAYGASKFFFSDPMSLSILTDIRNNLESTGSITADVDCQSNISHFSFSDGSIAMKDDAKLRFDKGSSGEICWRTDEAFNLQSPAYENYIGMRWDDSIEDPYTAWGRMNGLVDLRLVLGIGENLPVGLNAAPGLVTVNNVSCQLIESGDVRIYVDNQAKHRVIRCELDYLNSASLAFRTDFLQWNSCAGGEYPRQINCSHYRKTNHEDLLQLDYVLSNLASQQSLDDSLFELPFLPRDTSESSPPGTPPPPGK